MATLKDVALLANVSLSTASRILSATNHGSARYSQKTYARVIDASQKLGYRPNLNARALASGRSNIIALVYPRVITAPFAAPFIAKLIEHIEMHCSEVGFHMLLSAPKINNNEPEESYIKLMNSGYLDGVILIDSFNLPSLFDYPKRKNIPTIVASSETCSLQSDDQQGAYLLAKQVLSLGHRSIGFIGVHKSLKHRASIRFKGFKKAFEEENLSFNQCPRIDGDFSSQSGEQATKLLLNDHPELTAIMSLNDQMAVGAYRAARALGLDIPEDLSITGFDDLPIATELSPSLTTVHQPIAEMGQNLVDHLLILIEGQTPEQITLLPKPIYRESLSEVKRLELAL